MIGDFISTHSSQLLAAIAAIIWAIRLEGRVNSNGSEIRHLEKKIEDSNKARSEQRKEDMAMLQATLVEMRADIKILLMRDKNDSP